MTKDKKDKIVGGIIVAILFGVPLAIFLGPIAVIVFIFSLVIRLSKKKSIQQKVTEKQRRTDELITTILPIINPKN